MKQNLLLFFILLSLVLGLLIYSVMYTKNLPQLLEPFEITKVDGTFFFDGVNVGVKKKPNPKAFIDTNGILRVKSGINLKKTDGSIIKLNRKDIVRINEMIKAMYLDTDEMILYEDVNGSKVPVKINKHNLGILTGQLGYRIDYADSNERPNSTKNDSLSIFNFFPSDAHENNTPAGLHQFKFINVPSAYRDMGTNMAVGHNNKDYFCQLSLDRDKYGSLRNNNLMKLKEYDF